MSTSFARATADDAILWKPILAAASPTDLLIVAQLLCVRYFHRTKHASSLRTAFVHVVEARCARSPIELSADDLALQRACDRLCERATPIRERDQALRERFWMDGDRKRFLVSGETCALLDLSDADRERQLRAFVASAPVCTTEWLWSSVVDRASLALLLRLLGFVLVAVPQPEAALLDALADPLTMLAYDAYRADERDRALELLFAALVCGTPRPTARAIARKLARSLDEETLRRALFDFGIRVLGVDEDAG